MTPDKDLAQAFLRVLNAIHALLPSEKIAVLTAVGSVIQAHTQQAQLEANAALLRALNAPPAPTINDEHYRAQ